MDTENSTSQVSESDFGTAISQDVDAAGKTFAEGERRLWGSANQTWDIAADIVKQVQPVPWIFWIMIRTVYGRDDKSKTIDPMTFTLVENLLFRACRDKGICPNDDATSIRTVTKATELLGAETCAALAFMHAVCMRVSTFLSRRIFRAIMDDALIRARLGIVLGHSTDSLGLGAPMLAGFMGRAGLAVQLASGTEENAKKCLSSLATGQNISDVGTDIYGCDPLQVAALTLVAGGCKKEIALGVSAYSLPADDILPETTQARWLAMFKILEHARINTPDSIDESSWIELGFDDQERLTFFENAKEIFRKGHQFAWILSSLSTMLESE